MLGPHRGSSLLGFGRTVLAGCAAALVCASGSSGQKYYETTTGPSPLDIGVLYTAGAASRVSGADKKACIEDQMRQAMAWTELSICQAGVDFPVVYEVRSASGTLLGRSESRQCPRLQLVGCDQINLPAVDAVGGDGVKTMDLSDMVSACCPYHSYGAGRAFGSCTESGFAAAREFMDSKAADIVVVLVPLIAPAEVVGCCEFKTSSDREPVLLDDCNGFIFVEMDHLDGMTLAHELGHALRCHHQRGSEYIGGEDYVDGVDLTTFAYGYIGNGISTVMVPGTEVKGCQVWTYSNPDIVHKYQREYDFDFLKCLGGDSKWCDRHWEEVSVVPGTREPETNNARAIRLTYPYVVQRRENKPTAISVAHKGF